MDIKIRNEMGKDFREVEELTREAFWNLYFPGCNEHYLVRQFNSEVQHLGKQKGLCYPKWLCQNHTNIYPKKNGNSWPKCTGNKKV